MTHRVKQRSTPEAITVYGHNASIPLHEVMRFAADTAEGLSRNKSPWYSVARMEYQHPAGGAHAFVFPRTRLGEPNV